MKTFFLLTSILFTMNITTAQAQTKPNYPAKPLPKVTCTDVAKALVEYYKETQLIFEVIPQIYESSALLFEGIGTVLRDPAQDSRPVVISKTDAMAQLHRKNAVKAEKNMRDLIYVGDRLIAMSHNCITKGAP